MLRKMMRAKIHRARITECDPDYVGSIEIDSILLREVGIRPNEAVLVLDVDNGARFETYAIRGEAGSGTIGINGAAAKLVDVGHALIIVSFGLLTEDRLDEHIARVLICDEHNQPARTVEYPCTFDEPAAAEASP